MNPREDQYKAAIAEAEQVVQRIGQYAFVLRPNVAPATSEVRIWAERFAEELEQNITRRCEHGDPLHLRIVFGVEPNMAYCRKCADIRGRDLAHGIRKHVRMDCDFCQVDFPRATLAAVVFNIAAVVVQAASCGGCLASSLPLGARS
jgi:hypothetical protein